MIGDLEPPLDILQLLISNDAIKTDLTIDLDDEPLQSLLNYELAKLKPPPAPIPPPPPRPKKPKRDRKAEYERAKAKKAAAVAAAMATAAEALTLLNGGPHPNGHTVAEQHVTNPPTSEEPPHPSPPPLPPSAPSISRELQEYLDNSPGFRMSKPQHVTVDTNVNVGEVPTPLGTPLETSPMSPRADRHPRKKRLSFTFPGQLDIPPMVSDVDNRDSFRMFDAGWILPPDHRRGGRVPVDRSTQLQPPPRKRARTGMELLFYYIVVSYPVFRASIFSTIGGQYPCRGEPNHSSITPTSHANTAPTSHANTAPTSYANTAPTTPPNPAPTRN